MPRLLRMLLPVLWLLALPLSAAETTDADRVALRAVHDAWIAAYIGGDLAALERFYEPATVLMPDGRPTYRGWPAIRAFFAPGFERFDYEASTDLESIEVSGDLGSALGLVTVSLTPKGGGDVISRALRYLIVFRRDAAGEWRILYDMDNRAG